MELPQNNSYCEGCIIADGGFQDVCNSCVNGSLKEIIQNDHPSEAPPVNMITGTFSFPTGFSLHSVDIHLPPLIWHDDQNNNAIIEDHSLRGYRPRDSPKIWWKNLTDTCWRCIYRSVSVYTTLHNIEEIHVACINNGCEFEDETEALRGQLAAERNKAKVDKWLL